MTTFSSPDWGERKEEEEWWNEIEREGRKEEKGKERSEKEE